MIRPTSFTNKLLVCTSLLISNLLFSQSALSSQSLNAVGWYERMLAEAPKAQYQGIFTHQSGGQSQSVEIVHGMKDGQVWERLLHLDGPAREVIRKGEQLFCIHPDARVEKIDQPTNGPFAAESLASTQQLSQGYEFNLKGLQRIAGRPVMLLQLNAKDNLRHNYQVWLDSQTSVPLKSELINQRGMVLERYQFNYFAPYEQWNDKHFTPRTKGIELEIKEPVQTVSAQEKSQLETWKLNWMPNGFMQKDQKASGEGAAKAGRRMYSDGIVMFSVFVEPAQDEMKDGLAQVGATVLAVQHKQWQGQSHRITVVGEIPQQTAKRIAQSVELM